MAPLAKKVALGVSLLGAAVAGTLALKHFSREPTDEDRCRDGQLDTCFALALRAQHGLRARKDRARAAELFDLACDKGHKEACASSGQLLASAGKNDKAVVKYERACTLGSSRGCQRLADKLAKGEGVARDDARAAALNQRACNETAAPKERRAAACHALAGSYEAGRGVPADPARARALWEAACSAQPPSGEACGELGVRLLFGRNVAADPQAASGFLDKACKEKHAASCFELGRILLEGSGVASDPPKAEELFDLACQAGDKRGCEIGARRE